jgi:hypothetical protein
MSGLQRLINFFRSESRKGLKHNFKKKNKYNAVATMVDGFRFDSKKEAAYYVGNKLLQAKGEIVLQLRQVPFHLPGQVTYRLDFLEFYSNGNVRFVDVKGRDTPMSKLKRKQVEALYDIEITLA